MDGGVSAAGLRLSPAPLVALPPRPAPRGRLAAAQLRSLRRQGPALHVPLSTFASALPRRGEDASSGAAASDLRTGLLCAAAAALRRLASTRWLHRGRSTSARRAVLPAPGAFMGRRGDAAIGRSPGGARWRVAARAATRTANPKVRLSRSLGSGSFYDVLGVSSDASQEEVRSAYKKMIRETHPDVNPSPKAAEKFLRVQEAFRWLSDPQQRSVYDGVGSKFGEDALYDYTDEPILGSLDEVHKISTLIDATLLVNRCRHSLTARGAVKQDKDIKDYRKRFRKWAAERTMWVRDFFCSELRRVLEYPRVIKKLHPFERLSVELSLTQSMEREGIAFGQLLGGLKALRTTLCEEAAARAHACAKAERGRLATFIGDEAVEEMFKIVQAHEPLFQQFKAAQAAILRTPCINLDKPTVVFVGAPNVGKSSLVRSLSTGRPEVADYVFTTKSLTIGHIWHFIAGTPLLIHGQIVDSPGLRSPPGGNHNLLDQLTIGSMQHLPTAVVFVFDPYPYTHGLLDLEDQIELRERLREKFPRRPWLDVVTRVDLKEPEAIANVRELSRRYPEIVQVSCLEGDGLDILNTRVRGLLEEMTRVVRQLQRAKIRQLRLGDTSERFVSKAALAKH